jgi:hypothetical protein
MFSFKIMVLMAGAALQSGDALSIETPPNVHRMPVSIVALPGKVSTGMAIHATRMPEHRDDRFERCCGRRIIAYRFCCDMLRILLLRRSPERPVAGQRASCKRKHQDQTTLMPSH